MQETQDMYGNREIKKMTNTNWLQKSKIEEIYTADDEEPKCGRCDYFSDGFDCCGSCGPEHCWYGYTRTELVPIN